MIKSNCPIRMSLLVIVCWLLLVIKFISCVVITIMQETISINRHYRILCKMKGFKETNTLRQGILRHEAFVVSRLRSEIHEIEMPPKILF